MSSWLYTLISGQKDSFNIVTFKQNILGKTGRRVYILAKTKENYSCKCHFIFPSLTSLYISFICMFVEFYQQNHLLHSFSKYCEFLSAYYVYSRSYVLMMAWDFIECKNILSSLPSVLSSNLSCIHCCQNFICKQQYHLNFSEITVQSLDQFA